MNRLNSEIEKITRYLSDNQGLAGRVADQASKARRRPRAAVEQSIREARSSMAENGLEALADHFKSAIRGEGNTFAYRPNPLVTWELH